MNTFLLVVLIVICVVFGIAFVQCCSAHLLTFDDWFPSRRERRLVSPMRMRVPPPPPPPPSRVHVAVVNPNTGVQLGSYVVPA